MQKTLLRKRILEQRGRLPFDLWSAYSYSAQSRLLQLEEFQQAVSVALYAPINNETDTGLLFEESLAMGKKVFFPAVCGEQMEFRQAMCVDSFIKGPFGILEPLPSALCDCEGVVPDLVVVPAVAYDHSGHRIGYGKGYYDRLLGGIPNRVSLVGLCHDFQLIDALLPVEKHDIPVGTIVTDQQVIRACRNL